MKLTTIERGETRRYPARYFRGRLWKVQFSVTRIASRGFRLVKFYMRRPSLGAPWTIVHHAISETETHPAI